MDFPVEIPWKLGITAMFLVLFDKNHIFDYLIL